MHSNYFPDLDTRTYVMGILNLTSDSFSGDGLLNVDRVVDTALAQASRFLEEGADVLDLGAESTRPGAIPVTARQEIDRLVPLIIQLKELFPEVLISIDTYKAEVAEACLEVGAQIINDVWGFRFDPGMAGVVAAHQASAVLMHNRDKVKTSQQTELGGRYVEVEYKDVVASVKRGLEKSIELAKAAGLSDEQIIIDPGIGFGKTTAHNLELLKRLGELKNLGYPLLLGVSRKSVIGYTLDLPPDQRLEGSLAANAWGVTQGAHILRVHDVKETVRLVRMLDAIRAA
ncbi:MAG: dihydropteroate synthase [Anaerolineaceae bacterium]